jgi:hypothetical protein
MAQTTRKLNFMIDNDVADELEKYVPSGRRSKVVTQAIARELALQRRKIITDRLLELRLKTPKMTGKKLLSELAEDRKRR